MKRRWFRYSLRSFLLLLTVLCIWMGVLASQAIRQKKAIDAITAGGGEVHFDYDEVAANQTLPVFRPNGGPAGPAWLRKMIGDEYFRVVVGVGFSDQNPGNAAVVQAIEAFPKLKYLHIAGDRVTDDVLPRIATLRHLRYLGLNCPKLTPEGLKELRPLESLAYISSLRNSTSATLNTLHEPTWLEMTDAPLIEAAQYLSDYHHLPVRIDAALDQRRTAMLPITASLPKGDLATALKKILAPHELGFIVRDDAVIITTHEASEKFWAADTLLRSMFPNATVEADW